MVTTDNITCRMIAATLVAHGVTDVVVSPGSRNAPLIIAVSRHEGLTTHVVVDERCAAFFGLGIALQSGRPVALICTSGSAVLNYAPALSEGMYRQVPLIAISADRPVEWIDQDESQTIHQYGALSAVVKASYDIDVDGCASVSKSRAFFSNRTFNDALIMARSLPMGPVHIDVHIDEPLGCITDVQDDKFSFISDCDMEAPRLTNGEAERLCRIINSKRTMVLAGFGSCDDKLSGALSEFIRLSGAIVLAEAESNLSVKPVVANIDACLSVMNSDEKTKLAPELVITIGGSTVSRMIKSYLRSIPGLEQWHIGLGDHSVDSLMALTKNVRCKASDFFECMNACMRSNITAHNSFADKWYQKSLEAKIKVKNFMSQPRWCDFYAVGRLMSLIPRDWHLQFSNGTAIRYAQLFDYTAFNQIDCNRGVSGIDGSTSTAIGAHLYYHDVTLLITGDMSAQYDVGALAMTEITPRFKMAVLNNGGGGIFRFIKSTSQLAERERYFAADVRLPVKQLADGYGFAYYEANDRESFDMATMKFITESDRPAILNIITSDSDSASVLREFFNT